MQRSSFHQPGTFFILLVRPLQKGALFLFFSCFEGRGRVGGEAKCFIVPLSSTKVQMETRRERARFFSQRIGVTHLRGVYARLISVRASHEEDVVCLFFQKQGAGLARRGYLSCVQERVRASGSIIHHECVYQVQSAPDHLSQIKTKSRGHKSPV